MTHSNLTFVPGFRVGSAENPEAATGCTVVLCPKEGATFGLARFGGAIGTRQTDSGESGHVVDGCHAVLLTGGSAFGLDASGGVLHYLEERGIGFATRAARVPIVPSAVIYDLGIGSADVRPDAAMARAACEEAELGSALRLGNAGAGCGATVGKLRGMDHAMKGGLGSAGMEVRPGLFLAALAAVNPVGDVLSGPGGPILAGVRRAPDSMEFADSVQVLRELAAGSAAGTNAGSAAGTAAGSISPEAIGPENTILVVVATNARLTKDGARSLARIAGAGMARVVRPVHLSGDGDVVFALASGEESASPDLLGALATDLVAEAIVSAVRAAGPLHGVPAAG
ncbi:MAG: P1 family peptidase [Candidatus Eisenbacteria bacterium]